MLVDPYPVQPWSEPCKGIIRLPGSKSLTNRALVLAALSGGLVQLEGALFSRDTHILLESLTALGFSVDPDPGEESVKIMGQGGCVPNSSARIHVGNAGTAARFITALVCLHPDGRYEFDGDDEMRRRPMGGLIQALEQIGARFSFHGERGCFPFEVRTAGLRGGDWEVDASASSQMLSALMMVAPMAGAAVSISATGARPAFVEMTARLMRQFGIAIQGAAEKGFVIPSGQSYLAPGVGVFTIEPDASAASYFMMLPFVVGGSIKIIGMRQGMLQGDTAFARVLESLGMQIRQEPDGWICSVQGDMSSNPREFDFQTFSDTFLTLAACAPLLACPVRISGIGHTRFQETDRIHAAVTELSRLGAEASCEEEAVCVQPFQNTFVPPYPPTQIETYRDHRVAMAFAILGCSPRFGDGLPWLEILDPGCCGKTFPRFFHELENLYRKSHDI